MSTPSIVANIFVRAKGYITEYGWQQESYGSRTRGYCLDGAVVATVRDSGTDRYYASARNLLTKLIEQDGYEPSVWRWNDSPGREKAEVLALLDRAIEMVQPVD